MAELLRRFRYLWNRRRLDQELAGEMEVHRQMVEQEGGAPFGNTLRLREESRDAWGWTWIERLFQDLRYAARILRKSPGFTLAAVLMLALGIGVNIAAFGFFNLMVLKPLPIRTPETLMRFERRSPQSYASTLPYPEAAFFAEHSKTLSAVLAINTTKLNIDGEQKPLNANFVTANLFNDLGATPKLGRLLDPAYDGASGAQPVVVLSYGFWQRHFGGDPSIAGKTIRLNNKPITVIGVASDEFGGLSLDMPDLWAPITQQPYLVTGSQLLTDFSVGGSGVRMFGRLQPGMIPKVAENELRSLAVQLHKQHPIDIWENESLPSKPGGYADNVMGTHSGTGTEKKNEMYPVIALVGALVFLILAVACSNLGSLLLARGVAREREVAIRIAVGAGSGRLIRQLFTESLLLALLGSMAGLALGYLALRSLMLMTATPPWLNPAPDWRVVLYSIGVGFGSAILFGLTPALQVARQRHRATIMRQVLVGAQVAGSCVLLIVAGLLVRALDHALSANPGFEYQRVISINPDLSAHGYSAENSRTYLDTLESRIANLPGVESVSRASTPPLGRKTVVVGETLPGRHIEIHMNGIDPQFFQTMKIPLLRGRNLTNSDTHAVVISKSFALVQWPGEEALGKSFPMGDLNYTVIGIVGNARMIAMQDPDAVETYYLAGPSDLPSMVVLVKTTSAPETLLPFVSAIAKSLDPKIFPEVTLLKSSFQEKLKGARYSALSVSLLGLVALLLACLGIVGLLAYAVSQRTKEIGIRMALGAKPAHILSVVLRQFSRPVAIGLLAGVGGAAALSQILRRQLYGISNLDLTTYVAAIGFFIVTAGVASLLASPPRLACRSHSRSSLRLIAPAINFML